MWIVPAGNLALFTILLIESSRKYANVLVKTYTHSKPDDAYSLGRVFDIQVDKDNDDRWFIAHNTHISYAYVEGETKLSGLTKMVR